MLVAKSALIQPRALIPEKISLRCHRWSSRLGWAWPRQQLRHDPGLRCGYEVQRPHPPRRGSAVRGHGARRRSPLRAATPRQKADQDPRDLHGLLPEFIGCGRSALQRKRSQVPRGLRLERARRLLSRGSRRLRQSVRL